MSNTHHTPLKTIAQDEVRTRNNDDVPIMYAEGTSHDLATATNKVLTWGEFIRKLSTPKVTKETRGNFDALPPSQQTKLKALPGWFLGGPCKNKRRSRENVRPRRTITLDIDRATPDIFADLIEGKADLNQYEFFLHTTRKHRSDAPRIRIVILCSRRVTPDEYGTVVRILCFYFSGKKSPIPLVDKASSNVAQMMFFPSISKDGEFRTHRNEGARLDPDALLERYKEEFGDWKDPSNLPLFEGEAQPHEYKKAADPRQKRGPVGIWCRANDIETVMQEHIGGVYVPEDISSKTPRYTYAAGSSSAGAVVYNNGGHLYSYHGTDPCNHQLVNSFDLTRIHKFGHLDDAYDSDVFVTHLPSYNAMLRYAEEDVNYQRQALEERENLVNAFDDDIACEEATISPDGIPSVNGWEEPQEIIQSYPEMDFPVSALPTILKKAVVEVQGFTQAPMPLVAASALSALSLAVQSLVDVKRAERLTGPTSLFLLTIADSGERKSSCDKFFTAPVVQFEEEKRHEQKEAIARYKAEHATWEAKKAGINAKIRKAASGEDIGSIEALQEELFKLEQNEPVSPRYPKLVRCDETQESLGWGLANDWPSTGIISNEGGAVFGSHSMGDDSVMRTLSLQNTLWDGGSSSVGRRTTESYSVYGARLTVALQVQEATFRSFIDRSKDLPRGSGFLARFLICRPQTTQGTRFFKKAPPSWPSVTRYNKAIYGLLQKEQPLTEEGRLTPQLLSMSTECEELWVQFHNKIEAKLIPGGDLDSLRDVASKTADNAARLSALFHMLESSEFEDIRADSFNKASQIAEWYLWEAKRFLEELAVPQELADAVQLDNWLSLRCKADKSNYLKRRDIQRNVVPTRLRKDGRRLTQALVMLESMARLKVVSHGKSKLVFVNPSLLERDN